MTDIKKLLNGYHRELKALEKEEMRKIGAIDTMFSELKKLLDDDSLDNQETLEQSKEQIKKLKQKLKKAEKQLAKKVKKIEEIMEKADA